MSKLKNAAVDIENDVELDIEELCIPPTSDKKSKLPMSKVAPPGRAVVSKVATSVSKTASAASVGHIVSSANELFDFSKTSLSAIQQLYIMAFAIKGTRKEACAIAGCTYRQVDEWAKDDEFAIALQDAIDIVTDTLESELLKRAMDGSDKLLIKAIEARKPDYSPRQNINANVALSWADLARQVSVAPVETLEEEEV